MTIAGSLLVEEHSPTASRHTLRTVGHCTLSDSPTRHSEAKQLGVHLAILFCVHDLLTLIIILLERAVACQFGNKCST
eukprot:1922271-Amphidinium_carterae.1